MCDGLFLGVDPKSLFTEQKHRMSESALKHSITTVMRGLSVGAGGGHAPGLRAESNTCWNVPLWSVSPQSGSLTRFAPISSSHLCPQRGLSHLSQPQDIGPHSAVYV